MKTETALILLSIALLFYAAYYFSDKEAPQPEPPIETKLTGPCEDTIFLGYHFGMTEREFLDHTDQLLSEKIIARNGKAWQTELKASNEYDAFIATYAPNFENDQLVELLVATRSGENHVDHRLITLSLTRFYSDRYGSFSIGEGIYGASYQNNQGCYEITIMDGDDEALTFYSDLYHKQVQDSIQHSSDSLELEDARGKI